MSIHSVPYVTRCSCYSSHTESGQQASDSTSFCHNRHASGNKHSYVPARCSKPVRCSHQKRMIALLTTAKNEGKNQDTQIPFY